MVTPTARVDARGLFCPMPILKTSQAMSQLTSGQVLEVLATDAAAPPDFEAYSKQTGHKLLLSEENDGVYRFLVQHK